jgi:hypothetical protein
MNYYDCFVKSIINELGRLEDTYPDDVYNVVTDNMPHDTFAIMTLLDHSNAFEGRVMEEYVGLSLSEMMYKILFEITMTDVLFKVNEKNP